MTFTPPIGFADLVTCLGELRPNPAAALRLSQLLGVDTGLPRDRAPEAKPELPKPEPAPPPSGAGARSARAATGLPPRTRPMLAASPARSQVEPSAPHYATTTQAYPRESGEQAWAMPLIEPLFQPRHHLDLLRRACERTEPGSSIDVEVITAWMARKQPLVCLPRRARTALSRAVLVVLDTSDEMLAFKADQDDLVRRLVALMGRGRTRIERFRGQPRFPQVPADTTVIWLTNLSATLSGSASLRDWAAQFARSKARGQRTLALVPLSKAHWPKRLGRTLPLIEWSRRTTPRDLQRALRA